MGKSPEPIRWFSFFTFILEALYNKTMAQILPETEVAEVEGRTYINPQIAVGESDTFIDNLRQTQQANTQQIAQDTYNLGTAVPSNLGGLMGGEGYWASRYQTPQTNAAVANLRAAAQAKALNDVLANEQAIWKNRYQQAYRNYQKSAYDKANQPSTTGGGGTAGGVEYEDTTAGGYTGDGSLSVSTEGYEGSGTVLQSVVNPGSGYHYTIEQPSGKIVNTDDPAYSKSSDGYFYNNYTRKTTSPSVSANTAFGSQAGLGNINTFGR